MEKIDSIFKVIHNIKLKPFIIPVNLEHTKMISSTEFALRAGSNYYWSGDEVIKDLKKLFAWTYYYRVFDMVFYCFVNIIVFYVLPHITMGVG